MRLLDVHNFPPQVPEDILRRPPYAILSHVWEENELVFGDLFDSDLASVKPTGDKLCGAQRQATKDGLDFIWIDTLSIDKSSSAELGEAINSMYRWYAEADVCYVYLVADLMPFFLQADLDGCPPLCDSDLQEAHPTTDIRYWGARFRASRWFTRGWTRKQSLGYNTELKHLLTIIPHGFSPRAHRTHRNQILRQSLEFYRYT